MHCCRAVHFVWLATGREILKVWVSQLPQSFTVDRLASCPQSVVSSLDRSTPELLNSVPSPRSKIYLFLLGSSTPWVHTKVGCFQERTEGR